MYGLCGRKHHIVQISGDMRGDRATQLVICKSLSLANREKITEIFAISTHFAKSVSGAKLQKETFKF